MYPDLATIRDTFALLEDWEDRYGYVMELGRALEPLSSDQKIPVNQVSGCASQVWIVTDVNSTTSPPILQLKGDSDAHIVKGLVAIVLTIYSGKNAQEILNTDALDIFADLGLSDHLSSQRANGVRAVMARIRSDAQSALGRMKS
jgi:cysteine desulfuration protein SufE